MEVKSHNSTEILYLKMNSSSSVQTGLQNTQNITHLNFSQCFSLAVGHSFPLQVHLQTLAT